MESSGAPDQTTSQAQNLARPVGLSHSIEIAAFSYALKDLDDQSKDGR